MKNSWMKRTRKIIAGGVVFVMIVSACMPIKTVQAEETTEVETRGVELPDSVAPEMEPASPTEKPNTLVVTRKKCTYPKKLVEGQLFTVRGTLKSNHKLKRVVASIVDEQGENVCRVRKSAKSSREFDLSKVDDDMKFSQLPVGNYRYEIQVTDRYGNSREVLNKSFEVEESDWRWPVDGGVLGDTYRCKCSSHRGKHLGIDIKGVDKGTPIHAIGDGEVVYAQYHGAASLASFGKLVIIYHGDGIYSYYAHCNTLKCEAGDLVKKGDIIAKVGATGGAYGTHLHLEMRKGPEFNGKYNHYKLLDKYLYVQFNPLKRKYLKFEA